MNLARAMLALCVALAALLSVVDLASAPAYAGRASACKAPPFAVPSETQRAVDAAIDARVTGAGAGGVSTGVETRTDYETVTLSQDAAARAWFEYTICTKLAKKLISQELHDELLRDLLAPTIGSADARGAATGSTGPTGTSAEGGELAAAELVGTWQVTATWREGSCPQQLAGGSFAYTWLISTLAEDEISVSVQGKTSYGELRGTVTQGVLQVGGQATAGGRPDPSVVVAPPGGPVLAVLPRTDFRLWRSDDGLQGTRELVTWTSTLSDDNTTYTVLPCVMHYDVHATR